ncbi:MAG TPA: FAD-dependent monooxygenase [Casimicrobiaceae bacterium]|nr:FAD-dependent monooxygenase [Casimicrobiaceae bacterium]
MLRDLVVVGAGPVGATLALALAESELDFITLDARASATPIRADRSLALSHGARLIFERLDVWSAVAAAPGAVTPITAVDVSQRGAFGHVRLEADEHGLPALGYIVAYRVLQAALDAALARRGAGLAYDCVAARVSPTPAYARIEARQGEQAIELTARLVALADGGGELTPELARRRHDYDQVAVIGKLTPREPHRGVAYERFTPEGPMALLPEGDRYGLVWTTTPARGEALLALPDAEFLAALDERLGSSATGGAIPGGFIGVSERRSFALRLEYAGRVAAQRRVLLGNAAQSLHPVAGQGLNLGLRDAYELAQELLSTPRDAIGSSASLAAYAQRRRTDRLSGIAFTHGLLSIFGSAAPLVSWPRGLALTLLDCVPGMKRAFTRAMLFGM